MIEKNPDEMCCTRIRDPAVDYIALTAHEADLA